MDGNGRSAGCQGIARICRLEHRNVGTYLWTSAETAAAWCKKRVAGAHAIASSLSTGHNWSGKRFGRLFCLAEPGCHNCVQFGI